MVLAHRPFLAPRLRDGDRVLGDLPQIDQHERLVRPQAGELLNAPHRLRAIQRRRLHDVQRASDQVEIGGVGLHELRIAEDGLEQVVEVVRDPAGELAERRELLGLLQLRLDLALERDVPHDRDQAVELAGARGQGGERDGERHRGRAVTRGPRFEHVHRRAVDQLAPGALILGGEQ